MYYRDTEILFPMRVASQLRGLRGARWGQLIDEVVGSPDGSTDQVALSLLMVRQCGCLTCHPDCHRAMRGCTLCSQGALRRFRGDDQQLFELFEAAKSEVQCHPALKITEGEWANLS